MNAINSYCKKRLKNLISYLNELKKRVSHSTIHSIRVEIKKIKAILRLLHYHNPKFNDHKCFKVFRDLYRSCGRVREKHIIKNLIKHYSIDLEVTPIHNEKINIELKKQIPHYKKQIKRHSPKILLEAKEIKPSTLKDYINKRKKELDKILNNPLNVSELHKNRKLIKELLYLTSIENKKKKYYNFLLKSSELLGNWNDKQTLIQYIKENHPDKNDIINKLKTEATNDIKNLKDLISDYYFNYS
jgi:CHAD domain-containing protein